jgi:hypothetical protein
MYQIYVRAFQTNAAEFSKDLFRYTQNFVRIQQGRDLMAVDFGQIPLNSDEASTT